VAGVFGDEYAAVATLGGFEFGTASVTTIAMMVLCFHAIPVETALSRRIGFPSVKLLFYRLGLCLFSGALVGWIGGLAL
jgi:hypothetical protein